MLALSTELARYPYTGSFDYNAQLRSSVCGSSLFIGLDLTSELRVGRIGLQVAACAVGQSSAAILAGAIVDTGQRDIEATLEGLRAWLDGAGQLPQWPRLEALEAARDYPGRFGALLLPWEAAVGALSSAPTRTELSSDAPPR